MPRHTPRCMRAMPHVIPRHRPALLLTLRVLHRDVRHDLAVLGIERVDRHGSVRVVEEARVVVDAGVAECDGLTGAVEAERVGGCEVGVVVADEVGLSDEARVLVERGEVVHEGEVVDERVVRQRGEEEGEEGGGGGGRGGGGGGGEGGGGRGGVVRVEGAEVEEGEVVRHLYQRLASRADPTANGGRERGRVEGAHHPSPVALYLLAPRSSPPPVFPHHVHLHLMIRVPPRRTVRVIPPHPSHPSLHPPLLPSLLCPSPPLLPCPARLVPPHPVQQSVGEAACAFPIGVDLGDEEDVGVCARGGGRGGG